MIILILLRFLLRHCTICISRDPAVSPIVPISSNRPSCPAGLSCPFSRRQIRILPILDLLIFDLCRVLSTPEELLMMTMTMTPPMMILHYYFRPSRQRISPPCPSAITSSICNWVRRSCSPAIDTSIRRLGRIRARRTLPFPTGSCWRR